MTYLHTCQLCKSDPKDCAPRAALLLALRGTGVTSAKHRCAAFAPRYSPGDPVEVLTVAFMGAGPDEDRPPPRDWFPGHFVRYSGIRVIAYVKPGALSAYLGDDYPFESASGVVKVPRSRVRSSAWGAPICVDQCRECGAEPGLGQQCQRDPHYGRRSHCLAEKLSSEEQPSVCEHREQGNPATATPLLNTSEVDEKR